MLTTRVSEDISECQLLWEHLVPQERLFDLWGVRACFLERFNCRPHFIVVEEAGHPVGLAPLSWINEVGGFACFPGETWEGKTWIEQNRIVAPNAAVLDMLLASLPCSTHLRYLTQESMRPADVLQGLDEVNYVFYPAMYGYSFAEYMSGFSGRTRHKIEHELARLQAFGAHYRYDYPEDVKALFNLNLMKYGPDSYFSDPRFYQAFESLTSWLREQGMLRITSIFLGETLAAVDVGAVFRGGYTLLAGGVHPEFPGVAKMINLHHLQYACDQRLDEVDFLCGDFGWKERFRLSPRPLYQIKVGVDRAVLQTERVGTYAYA